MADNITELNSIKDARPTLRRFIEQAPLLKTVRLRLANPATPRWYAEAIPDTVSAPCPRCKHVPSTTWTETHRIEKEEPQIDLEHHWDITYCCADCGDEKLTVWVVIQLVAPKQFFSSGVGHIGSTEGSYRKIGQYRPWSLAVPKKLEKALGDNIVLFQRGLACLGQGYGIGASAYFRRIIEAETGALLDLVAEAAELEGDQDVLANLEDARKSASATDRLRIAAEKVPVTLRPGGVNPLAILYGHLSGPLHSQSEDASIQNAQEILNVFMFVFESLKDQLDNSKAYAASVQKLASTMKKKS